MKDRVEIMDTTLRDGEQTSGVSFAPQEKLSLARLLLTDLGVDRIEVASARVSEGERQAVGRIMEWGRRSGYLDRIEVLGFVDGGVSLDWIAQCGGRVINLLTKGSAKHCQYQLRKTPEQHIEDIRRDVLAAQAAGIAVNVYLEDWSNGMRHSPDYVYAMVDALQDLPIRRFMLPDTLGIFEPWECYEACRAMVERYPSLRFDFHAHNDYDLAVANVVASVRAGVQGVHTTVNGLGERAGNAPLSSVIAALHDHLQVDMSVNEARTNHVSTVVESYSGIRIPANKPVIGENVFTQCAGIHADGDNKNNLYFNDLLPERFGRTRQYALGKSSGKANIRKNLEMLGIELDEASMTRVTQYIVELGDRKEIVTAEDLPYIVSDLLGNAGDGVAEAVRILNYSLSVAQGLRPVATVKIEIHGQTYQQTSAGDGQYDAFVSAVRAIYKEQLGREFPILADYSVSIPPGGRTDAFVQTLITWEQEGERFKTRGLDADQTVAAIKATVKMLNKIEHS
ncbi:MAG: 2-isopropylmalate synthase [Rikenella sp.]|nr:2-isopropylmalate synthase [Rikenella sp.]